MTKRTFRISANLMLWFAMSMLILPNAFAEKRAGNPDQMPQANNTAIADVRNKSPEYGAVQNSRQGVVSTIVDVHREAFEVHRVAGSIIWGRIQGYIDSFSSDKTAGK